MHHSNPPIDFNPQPTSAKANPEPSRPPNTTRPPVPSNGKTALTDHLLQLAFSSFVSHGSLNVITAGGHRLMFGDGGDPKVTMRFSDHAAERALLWDPELKLGELYMDGRLVIEQGSIYSLFQLLLQDTQGNRSKLPMQVMRWVRSILRRTTFNNGLARARRNVAHHYDLDGRLYELFLDADWQYSCAYFERPDQGLEEAQLAKKRHIAAKLLVEPTSSVLDIGCGWGGPRALSRRGCRRPSRERHHALG
jgi:cyclopropane-fatty-acyl-phospholipid synthase